jgi:putative ABC transport system substrate-binding protein
MPLAARAQQPAMPVIGFLSGATPESAREPIFTPFHRGLGEAGYVEGRNVSIEYRWAEGHNERLPELAADLVRRQVAVIAVGGSTPGALAAKAATQSVSIVFLIGTDPVAAGIVLSLARPGGNITGCTILNAQIISKGFQLLRELVPAVRRVGMLVNPTNRVQAGIETKEAQAAAKIFEVHLVTVAASTPGDIEAAFATLLAEHVGALLVSGEYFFTTQRNRLIALASEHRLPTVYGNREITASGGLMS